jgi:hypothetical protein
VRFIADDFDAPAPLATDVPAKKTAKPKRRKKVS